MSKRGKKNYFKVGISSVKPTALTSLAALMTTLKSNSGCLLDTGASFIGNGTTPVNIGLEKAAKLGFVPDGDEDNRGDKEVKVTFSCTVVGIDLDEHYEVLRSKFGTGRNYVFLIDEEKSLVKWAGPLKMTFTDASEGNAIEKITISGEESGDLDEIYDRVTLD